MNSSLLQFLADPAFSKKLSWKRKQYAPQEVIIEEGDKNKQVYIILEGEVHVLTDIDVAGGGKRRAGLARLGRGEIFGELSMFDQQPHSANVIAAEPCELAVLDSRKLMKFLDANPKYGYRFLRYIVDLLIHRMRQDNVRASSILAWYLAEGSASMQTPTE